jgi:hypothetical protein
VVESPESCPGSEGVKRRLRMRLVSQTARSLARGSTVGRASPGNPFGDLLVTSAVFHV